MTKVMTKIQLEHFQTEMNVFVKKHGLGVLCWRAGLGTGAVEQVLKGGIADVNDEHIERIAQVIDEPKANVLKVTEDALTLRKCAKRAVDAKRMIAVMGVAGTGKTTVSKWLASTRLDVVYIDCNLIKSPREFMTQLAMEMNLPCTGNVSERLCELTRAFNKMKAPLLIVDECDKMHKDIRSVIHTLYDRTKNRMGILLVGMPTFRTNLLKGVAECKMGYEEFETRILEYVELKGLTKSEIEDVLIANGITEKEVQRSFRHISQYRKLENQIHKYKLEQE